MDHRWPRIDHKVQILAKPPRLETAHADRHFFPNGNIADNLVTTGILQLAKNFHQCVTLKMELARRIGRPGLSLFMLAQCAE